MATTERVTKQSANERRRRVRQRHAGQALLRWIALQPSRVWLMSGGEVRFLAATAPHHGAPTVPA